jgi:septum formation protein
MQTPSLQRLLKIPVPIVLASASPRRKKLLEQIGVEFSVAASAVNEDAVSTALSPADYVQTLALAKARDVASFHAAQHTNPAIIIGADTTVVLGKDILNKPASEHEAAQMLQRLSARTHDVFTGIALVDTATGRTTTSFSRTEVTFRALDDAEIQAYIATGSPMDKAGSYGIQDDFGAVFVREVRGCYYNVVGLPLELLYQELKAFMRCLEH